MLEAAPRRVSLPKEETNNCAVREMFSGCSLNLKFCKEMLKKSSRLHSPRRPRSYIERWRECWMGNLLLGIIALSVMFCLAHC